MVSEGADNSLRAVFAGRRGRLLIGLLMAEFAAATQGIAYSTVLPLAAQDLDGTSLYGATLASGTLATILVLAVGSRLGTRLGARTSLLVATAVFLAGVVLSAVAPTMVWVLVGSVLRGLAAGLLAAFGLTAIGGLFDDAIRPRVLALYALIWLLPSLVGTGAQRGDRALLGLALDHGVARAPHPRRTAGGRPRRRHHPVAFLGARIDVLGGLLVSSGWSRRRSPPGRRRPGGRCRCWWSAAGWPGWQRCAPSACSVTVCACACWSCSPGSTWRSSAVQD